MPKRKARGYPVRNYVPMPRNVLKHRNFMDLSGNAGKLLMIMYSEYRGHNNGDLSATHGDMKKYGYGSTTTLQAALSELIHYKFLVQTFAGGSHQCSLYAVTWIPIMSCNGKLQELAETKPRWNEREVVEEKWSRTKWMNRRMKKKGWTESV